VQGPAGNPASDDQNLSVSATGDTLFLQNGGFVIIPGISAANNGGGGQTGITAHSCGAGSVHNPAKTYGTMTDQEGNVYKTIVIGTQEWMAENLNTSIYRNGDAIPTNLDDSTWTNTTSGAWAYYINDVSYACPYGKLYNWYACVDARQLCPVGWHVPTNAEWTVLIDNLGGVTVAGGIMKSTGTIQAATGLWFGPNTEATNSSGFSGSPGGLREYDFSYGANGVAGFWWSSSDGGNGGSAWNRCLRFNDSASPGRIDDKHYGFSVRCLRD
jgi:uncharacterized protein (TIGR02145 family)